MEETVTVKKIVTEKRGLWGFFFFFFSPPISLMFKRVF